MINFLKNIYTRVIINFCSTTDYCKNNCVNECIFLQKKNIKLILNAIKSLLHRVKEFRIKNEELRIKKKLKIEAQSQTMICLQNHCSLSFGEVPAEQSEDENGKLKIKNKLKIENGKLKILLKIV